MHAPFERQAERKMKPGEGLFSLLLPKFESYQPGMLNTPAAIRRQPTCAQHQAKSLQQLHVGNAAARTRTVSAAPISAKSAEIPRQYGRTLIPTDSAVRVRPPQPRSRSRRSHFCAWRNNSELIECQASGRARASSPQPRLALADGDP